MHTRLAAAWLSVAWVAYFVVTAPVEAADLTRSLLGRLAAAAHSGIVFVTTLAT